jgi:formylmethanofuran dehydrogenase subunit E
MTIIEKTAYLKGLADGLGVDPQSKEGKLWAALNDVLSDIAHDLELLHKVDQGQAEALDGVADELSYLEELCSVFDKDDYEKIDDEDNEDEELEYDGVIYDATCPVCGEEISFDEETLEAGSIQCPKCGELLEFDLGEEEKEASDKKTDENPS